MARELAVVLVNGSINSTVALALAAQRHRPIAVFVEASPNAARAAKAFDALVAHYKPYRSHRFPMPFLAGAPRPSDARAVDLRGPDGVVAGLVDLLPIVGLGMRLAAQYGATALYAGHRAGANTDALARITEHAQVWSELAQVTCDRPELEFVMPLLEMEPWQVIDVATQANAPLAMTWSCLATGLDACGTCAGCNAREAAFQRAGRPDPARPTTPVRRD